MCILSYLPSGIEADVDGLLNGGIANPHGHGWAIVAKDVLLVGKSLDIIEALDTFTQARELHPEGPALFHSRWATHGSVRVNNVHPFRVGGSNKTVVAHNGILPKDAHPAKGDDRSDTRKFADEILSTRFRRLDKPSARAAMAQWCGSYNKLVILTVDPRYRHNAYLVNEHKGHWDSHTGIWHSNYDYLAPRQWWGTGKGIVGTSTTGTGGLVAADDWDYCLFCGYGVVDSAGYCDECTTCADCCEAKHECTCWEREEHSRLLIREGYAKGTEG